MKKGNKKRIRAIQLKAQKASNRFKRFTKYQNKFNRRRVKRNKRQRPDQESIYNNINKERIQFPSVFSISEDMEAVLLIIYQTKKLFERKRYKNFDFDLSKVTKIDDGAATILLSLCHDIDHANRKVRVQFPANPDANKFISEIGFRKFFAGHIPKKDALNQTIKKGKAKILQRDTVPIIHRAMKTVFGIDSKNQRLQGMLIELMTNSVNHAYLANNQEKTWYISTRHDTEENKVEFCFVDNGDGIINTINVRLKVKLFSSPEDILIRAFEGEFRSRTKLTNRGRGLIVIKKNHNKMTVRGLKVITNDVFLDFETGIATKLETPFKGTFYSWILDQSCK